MREQRRPGRYPVEMRERAVRMVFEAEQHTGSRWEAICSVAEKLGPTPETVRKWVLRVEIDEGRKPGVCTDERGRLKELERENREPRRANDTQERFGFLRGRARRPSTALDDDCLHRRTPSTVWGRADLQGVAVRPVDVLVSEAPAHIGPVVAR